MEKEENYISNLDCSLWRVDDLGLYAAKSPIHINSLGGNFDAWFDMDGESFLTAKQLTAWTEFCNVNPMDMKEMIMNGLIKLADKMDALPNDVELEYGPIYKPIVISRNVKRSVEVIKHSERPLGKMAKSTLKCSSVVVPLQDRAPVRFIVMKRCLWLVKTLAFGLALNG